MPTTTRVSVVEGVLTVTLDRPRSRNAMSEAMVNELAGALVKAEREDEVRIMVVRGAGGHFSAGGDVRDMTRARAAPVRDGVDPLCELNAAFGHMALAFSRTDVPVVAVIEGSVMGGGFGLVCTVDVAIASTTAEFRLPETSLGLIPAQIAPFLIERLGYSEAKRLAVTGAQLDAKTALDIGLIHEVWEPEKIETALERTLDRIRACAPTALGTTKRLLRALRDNFGNADIDHAAEVFAKAARSEEAAEGMRAFLEKRAPSWASRS